METARQRVLYLHSPLHPQVESPESPEMPSTQDDLKKGDWYNEQSTSGAVLSPFFPNGPVLERRCTASLVGDKYLILDIPEGSTLNKCINVQTQEELVCKAGGILLFFFPSSIIFQYCLGNVEFFTFQLHNLFHTSL